MWWRMVETKLLIQLYIKSVRKFNEESLQCSNRQCILLKHLIYLKYTIALCPGYIKIW
jgi:hypothetical protein